MAITPRANICSINKCSGVRVTDVTGVYDADTNTGGWGDPNDDSENIISVKVIIDDTQYSVTDNYTLPITGDVTYDIETDLSDGWHDVTITYTVQIPEENPTTIERTYKIFTFCNIECCIFNKLHELTKIKDLCKNKDLIVSTLYMWGLLQQMKKAANGCYADEAETILEDLTAMCNGPKDCGCK